MTTNSGKFGARSINPGTGRLIQHAKGPGGGKGGSEQLLPSRHAMAQVTKGDPWQRSMGNYAKLAPSGANAPVSYQDIIDMAGMGVSC